MLLRLERVPTRYVLRVCTYTCCCCVCAQDPKDCSGAAVAAAAAVAVVDDDGVAPPAAAYNDNNTPSWLPRRRHGNEMGKMSICATRACAVVVY